MKIASLISGLFGSGFAALSSFRSRTFQNLLSRMRFGKKKIKSTYLISLSTGCFEPPFVNRVREGAKIVLALPMKVSQLTE